MPYLDESRLSTYNNNLKEWISSQESKTITSNIYPWTKTAKAGAVSCYPVGGTDLKPIVEFLFTEVPPSSGDKGPSNPSAITGVTQAKVTRCEKNLCPLIGTSSSNLVSVSFSAEGEFVFNGTSSSNTLVYVFHGHEVSIPDYLEIGKTYTFSLYGDVSTVKFTFYRYWGTSYGSATFSIVSGQSYTLTIPDTKSILLRFEIPVNTVLNNAKFKLQIEEGSFATEFEPYTGTDYTFSLNSTYYGGTLDTTSGVMTVTHAAVTPDASTVDISSNPAAIPLDYADTYGRTIISADGTSLVVGSTGGTVVYKLATPYTVQLTPTEILSLTQADKYTPRLNTIYTDASAVQVGYVKSPIREEYELTQAIVAQGGNI